MIHQCHIVAIVLANLRQAIGELLAGCEQLLEAAEATGHGVAPGINNASIWQDQMNQADMAKIVRHFVDEIRCALAKNLGVTEIGFAKLI